MNVKRIVAVVLMIVLTMASGQAEVIGLSQFNFLLTLWLGYGVSLAVIRVRREE